MLATVIEWAGIIDKQQMTEKGSKHKRDSERNCFINLSNARVLLELKLLYHSSINHIANLSILSPSDKLCEAFTILLYYLTFTVFFQNVLNYVFIVDLLVN